ncbi:CGA synthase-related protein [Streptomyces sp. NPDC000594]|uniref:CGA synthase-related protein n=1 Tax=Streptomyces sp. NPDC000594 TaxID=3154261 RepID=UPI003326BF51
MAVLTPRAAPPRRRVLLVDDPRRLDSLTARRRIAVHLREMDLLEPTGTGGPAEPGTPEGPGEEQEEQEETVRAGWYEPRPHAALVCDDPAVARRLTEHGVAVVHLHSGHRAGRLPATTAAVHQAHAPAWLPGPRPSGPDPVHPTGLLAPARLTRSRTRTGTLLLVSAYGTPRPDLARFAATTLRALAAEAVRRTGGCEVVCDTGTRTLRTALEPVTGAQVRPARAVDTDALHATARAFIASPTLTALSLAQARRSPLAFLPPLGADQEDLARRTAPVMPVRTVDDPAGAALWAVHDSTEPWPDALDTDDLRGAQRVARRVRQLALAPMAF